MSFYPKNGLGTLKGDEMKVLKAPLKNEDLEELKVGEEVLIAGTIYAARDAVHRNMYEVIINGQELPVDLNGQIIYYVGPCRPRRVK